MGRFKSISLGRFKSISLGRFKSISLGNFNSTSLDSFKSTSLDRFKSTSLDRFKSTSLDRFKSISLFVNTVRWNFPLDETHSKSIISCTINIPRRLKRHKNSQNKKETFFKRSNINKGFLTKCLNEKYSFIWAKLKRNLTFFRPEHEKMGKNILGVFGVKIFFLIFEPKSIPSGKERDYLRAYFSFSYLRTIRKDTWGIPEIDLW